MKISKDINEKFSDKELEKLSKNTILLNLKVWLIMISFFTLFASLVLFIIGGVDEENRIFLYVAIGLMILGIITTVLSMVGNSRNKKIQARYVNQLKKEVLGIEEIYQISLDKLNPDYLKETELFNQTVNKFYINNYWFKYQTNIIKIYNIQSSLVVSTKNQFINEALTIKGNNAFIGNIHTRIDQDVPFKGSIVEVELLKKKEYIFEVREIIDSIYKSKIFLESDKRKINDEIDKIFDIYYKDQHDNGFKDKFNNLIQSLVELINLVKGVALIVKENKCYLALYDYYFNFEQMFLTKKIIKLGDKYKNIQKEYLPIKKVIDEIIEL